MEFYGNPLLCYHGTQQGTGGLLTTIRPYEQTDLPAITAMAARRLKRIDERCAFLPQTALETVREQLSHRQDGLVLIKDDSLTGYLLFDQWADGDGIMHINVPVGLVDALEPSRAALVSRLFERLAADMVKKGAVEYQIGLYADDETLQRLFFQLQFGMQCVLCQKDLSPVEGASGASIRELDKQELAARWDEIWLLLDRLIDQLRRSPVFYPCKEFTQAAYRESFLDEGTRVLASERDGRLTGVIEYNTEKHPLTGGLGNIGDVYVLEEYRGTGLAQALLNAALADLEKAGESGVWLMHGTANPTARGFWDKYFASLAVYVIREIRPV